VRDGFDSWKVNRTHEQDRKRSGTAQGTGRGQNGAPAAAGAKESKPAQIPAGRDRAWQDAIVRYLVHPKESGRVKTRITKKLLDRLNTEPEKVLFPKSNMRKRINLAKGASPKLMYPE
jgi:hypothetical protein